jgi:hypothetical protein
MGISNAEITNYVNQNIDDFDTDMIINNIGTGSNQSIQNVNNTEIQEYLDNEGW